MSQPRPLLLLAVLLALCSSGCAWGRNLFGGRGFLAPAPCALSPTSSVEDVVAHLNENSHKLTAWRTTKGTISTRGAAGVPVTVSASIAVESPRNFRLQVNGPMGGNEVDLGSNTDQFWFWNKRNEEKYVFTARHDQESGRMQRFPIPFQPDWIMEALGVINIDPEETILEPGPPRTNTAILRADRVSPQGASVKKVTVVDLCRGVIREHALYDARGRLIARAVLSEHIRDKASEAVIPTKIDLEWPQAQLGLTMRLFEIEVNPRHIPVQTWIVPSIPGYAVYDLTGG